MSRFLLFVIRPSLRRFENNYGYVIIDKRSLTNRLRFNRYGEFEWVKPIQVYLGLRLLEVRTIKRDRILELLIKDEKKLFIAGSLFYVLSQHTRTNIWVRRLVVLETLLRFHRKVA